MKSCFVRMFLLICLLAVPGREAWSETAATSVAPTPTWTAAQEKAYHRRVEAYRTFGYKTPPKNILYICAFCGHKSHSKGLCPKCGFEMTPYDPKAKTRQKVYSSGSM